MTPLWSSGGGLNQERRNPVDVTEATVTLRGAEAGAALLHKCVNGRE